MPKTSDDLVDTGDPFFGCFMSQHGSTDTITDCVNAGSCSLVILVDYDYTILVGSYTNRLKSNILGVCSATGANENARRLDWILIFATNDAFSVFYTGAFHPHSGTKFQTLLFKCSVSKLGNFAIGSGQNSVKRFEHDHAGSESVPN